MEQQMITNGGLQCVPQIAVQYVYLDFDGELTSYNGEILTVDTVEVQDSALTQERIADILSELNARYVDQNVIFVTEKPETTEYSTIYIGKTSAFDQYGNFAGVAETIDTDNQNKSDKAFVMLDATADNAQILSTISHETDHLLGPLDHGGDGIGKYALGATYTGGLSEPLNIFMGGNYASAQGVNIFDGGYMTVLTGGSACNTTISSGGIARLYNGTMTRTTINSGGKLIITVLGNLSNIIIHEGGSVGLHWYQSGYVPATITEWETGIAHNLNGSGNLIISSGGVASNTTIHGGKISIAPGAFAYDTIIYSYGRMNISGTISNTMVRGGYVALDYNGSVANHTVVDSGGTLTVYSGTIVDTIVENSAEMGLYHNAILGGTTTLKGTLQCGDYVDISDNDTQINLVIDCKNGNLSDAYGGYIHNLNALHDVKLNLTIPGNILSGEYCLADMNEPYVNDITLTVGANNSCMKFIWNTKNNSYDPVTVNDVSYQLLSREGYEVTNLYLSVYDEIPDQVLELLSRKREDYSVYKDQKRGDILTVEYDDEEYYFLVGFVAEDNTGFDAMGLIRVTSNDPNNTKSLGQTVVVCRGSETSQERLSDGKDSFLGDDYLDWRDDFNSAGVGVGQFNGRSANQLKNWLAESDVTPKIWTG